MRSQKWTRSTCDPIEGKCMKKTKTTVYGKTLAYVHAFVIDETFPENYQFTRVYSPNESCAFVAYCWRCYLPTKTAYVLRSTGRRRRKTENQNHHLSANRPVKNATRFFLRLNKWRLSTTLTGQFSFSCVTATKSCLVFESHQSIFRIVSEKIALRVQHYVPYGTVSLLRLTDTFAPYAKSIKNLPKTRAVLLWFFSFLWLYMTYESFLTTVRKKRTTLPQRRLLNPHGRHHAYRTRVHGYGVFYFFVSPSFRNFIGDTAQTNTSDEGFGYSQMQPNRINNSRHENKCLYFY